MEKITNLIGGRRGALISPAARGGKGSAPREEGRGGLQDFRQLVQECLLTECVDFEEHSL